MDDQPQQVINNDLPPTENVYNAPISTTKYVGFWQRLVAHVIDGLILGIPLTILNIVLSMTLFSQPQQVAQTGGLPTAIVLIQLANTIIAWLYYAGLESSKWQATIGKRAVGAVVVDFGGNRITLLRATARHFAKILSFAVLLIGFIMVGLTAKKQGLHDMLAQTFVIKK